MFIIKQAVSYTNTNIPFSHTSRTSDWCTPISTLRGAQGLDNAVESLLEDAVPRHSVYSLSFIYNNSVLVVSYLSNDEGAAHPRVKTQLDYPTPGPFPAPYLGTGPTYKTRLPPQE